MTKTVKRTRSIREKVVPGKPHAILEALAFVKEGATAKFDETIDVAINLGIDAQKTDQAVRGSTLLPHGSGRKVSVAVFAQGANAEAAKKAGADTVGYEDLAESMKAGNLNYDVVIATPEAMRLLGQLGQVLGPKGLMPNPKLGTVTNDVGTAVKNAKAGQVRFRTDKAGVVHCTIGKASFPVENLKGNFDALLSDIKKAKPTNTKGMGVYIKKITVSSTMGPGVIVDQGSL